MDTLFFHCRAGFEQECALELGDLFTALNVPLEASATEKTGYVIATGAAADIANAADAIHLSDLIFSRSWFAGFHLTLDPKDRITTIMKTFGKEQGAILLLETPDTSEGKELQGLCRGIRAPLEQAMKKKHMLIEGAEKQFHVCFMSGTEAYVGSVSSKRGCQHEMGIMRLRMPKNAPSRSTLKLEEAFHEFIPHDQHTHRLRPKMHAVDLGAAPGGWTYQLVERGLSVVAVDNGPMDRGLMLTKQVEHKRADGFMYRPAKKVDWLVCDMVEKPARVADLLAKWLSMRWTQEAIVNLKLPMKKRYEEVLRCMNTVALALEDKHMDFEMRAKQLYHDREEVTLHVRVFGK